VTGDMGVPRYVGVKPPPLDVPLVELETEAGRVIDLYNECRLRSVRIESDEWTFAFLSRTSEVIEVRFSGVRRMLLEQPLDFDPREAAQIEHLQVRPEGDWRRFRFLAGGLVYEFDAQELALTVALDDEQSSPLLLSMEAVAQIARVMLHPQRWEESRRI
jgi:hypothetical protein